ncbi:protein transport protein SEC23 D-like isoform X1 [Aristolochia californica]|uniref:protein transport protein SEC23 D-like isoform X1 n=1 Tax=Aristolochia californica TaxID=171875 RepID=UPI0035E38E4A
MLHCPLSLKMPCHCFLSWLLYVYDGQCQHTLDFKLLKKKESLPTLQSIGKWILVKVWFILQGLKPWKDRIAAALETLKPTTSWERTIAAGQGLDGILLGGRGFGAAMEALINYLGSEYGNTFALARVFTFLSGPPDYGASQLDTRRYGEQYASKGEDADCTLLPEQTPFYKELAAVAVQSGVCVDIFAVTNEYTDLASLKFLSIESGGSLFLYSNTDDSTLPQDIYRMLSRSYAFRCILRLRTSSDFQPGRLVWSWRSSKTFKFCF